MFSTVRQHFFTLACLVVTLALFSCRKESTVSQATRSKILIVGNGAEPKTLDPHLVNGVPEGNIIRAIIEGLTIDHPSKDGVAVPGAAEKWEHNEDFTEWIFHLRKDGKWSDGTPVTAADFTFAFERILTPQLAAGYAEMLFIIKNAEAFNKGDVTDFSQVGVTAIDDHTLKISLRASVPYLPEVAKHYTWSPVPKHLVLKHGKIADRFTPWAKPPNIVTNGPFVPTDWKITTVLSVRRNAHYWDNKNVQLDGIDYFPVTNEFTESRMFLDGQLHLTYTLPTEMISYAKKNNPNMLRSEAYVGTYFLRCNTQKKPLNDPKVRLALATALDRKSICDEVLQGGKNPASGIVPPFGDYKEAHAVNFDPAKAKQILTEAGFADGSTFPELTLLTTDKQAARSLAEAIQQMWRQHLGIKVRIEMLEWSSYRERQDNMEYDICAAGWIGDYLDPTTFLDMWVKGGGNNKTGWSSETFEKTLQQAAKTSDPNERTKILSQAERTMLGEMPVIPIYFYATNYFLRPEVKNWNPLLLNNHPFKFVRLESTP